MPTQGFNGDPTRAAAVENSIHARMPSSPPAPAMAGYYEFDEAGFTNAINQVSACIDKIRELRRTAQPMTGVLPMGNEPSSRKAAAGINASGAKYLEHNKALENAYQAIHDDLVKARDTYLAQEQHAAGAINTIQRNM